MLVAIHAQSPEPAWDDRRERSGLQSAPWYLGRQSARVRVKEWIGRSEVDPVPAAAPRLEKQSQAQWLAWRLFFDVPRAIPALGRWVARDVTRVIITTWIAASSRRWRGIRSGFRRSERLLSQWNRKS